MTDTTELSARIQVLEQVLGLLLERELSRDALFRSGIADQIREMEANIAPDDDDPDKTFMEAAHYWMLHLLKESADRAQKRVADEADN